MRDLDTILKVWEVRALIHRRGFIDAQDTNF